MNMEPAEKFDRILGARYLLKFMKILGVWKWKQPNSSQQDIRKYNIIQYFQRIILHFLVSFTFVTLTWIGAFVSEDLNQASDYLYMSLAQTAISIKIINMWWYSDKAWEFINELTYSQEYMLLHPREIKMWQQKQLAFRKVVLTFAFSSVLTVVVAFVGVLFVEEYQLPFAYWVPLEWRTNSRNYWFAYLFDMISIAVTCLTNVSNDMMGCYLLFHLSLLYKVLGFRLARLKDIKDKDADTELRKIIKFHKNIRRLTRDCETIVSWHVLSQIVFSALIVCFCGYRLQKLNILQNLGQFFAMLQFMFIMIFEIYLPCYYANEITFNSSELCFQIYRSDWLAFSVSTRKLIYLYMEFLKHPEQIKIANYFDIGLPLFTRVMNSAYRVFALLMNVEN